MPENKSLGGFIPIGDIKPHPLAHLVPPMRDDEWDEFYTDVSLAKIRGPIEILPGGTILDGHHRYRAALELGMKEVPWRPAPLHGDDPETYMLKAAVLRRQLTDDQRAQMAARWKRENHEKSGPKPAGVVAPQRRGATDDRQPTRSQAVSTFKVTRRKVDDSTKLLNTAPELADRVFQGDMSLRDAKHLETLDESDREKALSLIDTGQAKNAITARTLIRRDNARNTPPPTGKYQVIYADPSWEYEFGFDIHGASNRHYNTMTIEELCELPIKDLADDNAVLFMWVTSPKLSQCFAVIDAWGFEYKTSFVWDKVKHVMGHYNSVRHEFLLLAIRGSYPKQSNTLHDSVITLERTGDHSSKPVYFRDLIDEMYPGSEKIELFARGTPPPRPKWAYWGHEYDNTK